MATRRPVHRKQPTRSTSKIGLLLCVLLAGAVMVVPLGSDVVRAAKMKMRDLALSAGLIDFKDCVVTPDHAIACGSHATGLPLPAALRRIKDSEALAAAEKEQRQRAEDAVRQLALEVQRLNTQARQSQLARGGGFFFPPSADVRPTGLTGTGAPDESGSSFTLTPPPEGD